MPELYEREKPEPCVCWGFTLPNKLHSLLKIIKFQYSHKTMLRFEVMDVNLVESFLSVYMMFLGMHVCVNEYHIVHHKIYAIMSCQRNFFKTFP